MLVICSYTKQEYIKVNQVAETKLTTVEATDKYAILKDWDLSFVSRYMKEREGYTDDVFLGIAIDEYKKFIAICSAYASPTSPVIMGSVIDPVWHVHILFTKDYTRMCNKVAGGYLHHDPAFPEELGSLEEGYSSTLGMYAKNFGTPSKTYWPSFAQICTGSSCACSGPGNE